MKLVQESEPGDVKQFMEAAPKSVVGAMQQTVRSIVGNLPGAYFDVKVETVSLLGICQSNSDGQSF